MTDETVLLSLLAANKRGILATIKRDGRPQLSNVAYDWDAEARLIRISVTDSRAKTHNLRRDPRATFEVTTDGLAAYAVVDGDATLSAVTTDPHDTAADELVDLYRSVAGEHPDWEEYRAAMVAERRLVARISVGHVYGWIPG